MPEPDLSGHTTPEKPLGEVLEDFWGLCAWVSIEETEAGLRVDGWKVKPNDPAL